jgi:hypothetical protein
VGSEVALGARRVGGKKIADARFKGCPFEGFRLDCEETLFCQGDRRPHLNSSRQVSNRRFQPVKGIKDGIPGSRVCAEISGGKEGRKQS